MRTDTSPTTLGALVARRAEQRFTGRAAELEQLVRVTDEGQPIVTFVHGLGGIGKSALLAAAVPRLRERGARVLVFAGGSIEPTPRGMLDALGEAIGKRLTRAQDLGDALARDGRPTVLAFDEYESLMLIDAWIRRELLASLPLTARVLLFSRHTPHAGWYASPGWSIATRTQRLGPLDAAEARALLEGRGVGAEAAEEIVALAHGHPLTLELAASAYAHDHSVAALRTQGVLETLARLCLEDIADPRLRACVECASIVRRATRPVLESMLEGEIGDALVEDMLALPFVERAGDGLVMHESVRAAIEARLRAIDPARHAALRARAWRAIRKTLDARGDTRPTWRAAADALFLVQYPEIREAVFPSDPSTLTIDSALPSDEDCVLAITRRHAGEDEARAMAALFARHREHFRISRDAKGGVAGFLVLHRSDQVDRSVEAADPLLRAWREDLEARGEAKKGALFVRRILAAEEGELPSDPRAALWIDAKRAYFEHSDSAAVYMAGRIPRPLIACIERFGFRVISGPTTNEERPFVSMRLDFGDRGVFGWLARLIDASEHGAPDPLVIEEGAIVLDGVRTPLTLLEHGALTYLVRAHGRTISREELLEKVWKQRHGGSNVVDAVIRLVRKKLGSQAARLETVKGFGYRFVPI